MSFNMTTFFNNQNIGDGDIIMSNSALNNMNFINDRIVGDRSFLGHTNTVPAGIAQKGYITMLLTGSTHQDMAPRAFYQKIDNKWKRIWVDTTSSEATNYPLWIVFSENQHILIFNVSGIAVLQENTEFPKSLSDTFVPYCTDIIFQNLSINTNQSVQSNVVSQGSVLDVTRRINIKISWLALFAGCRGRKSYIEGINPSITFDSEGKPNGTIAIDSLHLERIKMKLTQHQQTYSFIQDSEQFTQFMLFKYRPVKTKEYLQLSDVFHHSPNSRGDLGGLVRDTFTLYDRLYGLTDDNDFWHKVYFAFDKSVMRFREGDQQNLEFDLDVINHLMKQLSMEMQDFAFLNLPMQDQEIKIIEIFQGKYLEGLSVEAYYHLYQQRYLAKLQDRISSSSKRGLQDMASPVDSETPVAKVQKAINTGDNGNKMLCFQNILYFACGRKAEHKCTADSCRFDHDSPIWSKPRSVMLDKIDKFLPSKKLTSVEEKEFRDYFEAAYQHSNAKGQTSANKIRKLNVAR